MTSRYTEAQVSGLTGITAISAGLYHSLALKNDGTVWAWGWNAEGQLGDGTTTTRTTPVQVTGLTGTMMGVSAGYNHSLILASDYKVWACGQNAYGQCGVSGAENKTTPVNVVDTSGIGSLSAITKVAAGGYHSVALKSDGEVYSWGMATNGQLGDGNISNRYIPTGALGGMPACVVISAGEYFTATVDHVGRAWAWGFNSSGQLGNGTVATSLIPVQVVGSGGNGSIACGAYHVLSTNTLGAIVSWGGNDHGQLGIGSKLNKRKYIDIQGILDILPLPDVIRATGGHQHSLALKNDGTVWAWGLNNYGQLGDGTTTNKLSPVQVSGLTGIIDIQAGWYHSLALKNDGTVWAWGWNDYGQLGDGTTTTITTPVQVLGGSMGSVNAIEAGWFHSLAITSAGAIWAWGGNDDGQLGDGTTTTRTSPVSVAGTFTDIYAGGKFSAARTSVGGFYTWGRNNVGQLGDGTTTSHYTPTVVPDLTTGVTSVAACGDGHVLVLKAELTRGFPRARENAITYPQSTQTNSLIPILGASAYFMSYDTTNYAQSIITAHAARFTDITSAEMYDDNFKRERRYQVALTAAGIPFAEQSTYNAEMMRRAEAERRRWLQGDYDDQYKIWYDSIMGKQRNIDVLGNAVKSMIGTHHVETRKMYKSSGLGSLVGMAAGAALGSFLGPAGMMMGAQLGGAAGGVLEG
jgi:alpha-tubulin suppressor-like RCC1 family protein